LSLPAHALITLQDLKDYIPLNGSEKDSELERFIGLASSQIEGQGVRYRRLVYRGPVESYVSIVSGAVMANGALALAGAPAAAGRTIVVRKNDPDRGLAAGTLTISQAAPVLSETFDLTTGDELHGTKFFTAAVTATLSGVNGAGVNDTIDVGTSEGYTEYYSPSGNILEPLEWPVRSVIVHEDQSRLYPVGTLLVLGTNYELRGDRSIARLASAGQDQSWASGSRSVRVRMSAGYKGTGEVPESIKGVCRELAAWYYQHADRKQYGLQSNTDAMGSRSFTGPPILTDGMKAVLQEFWRPDRYDTAERGWSEVA
jgi:hypothetical protein